MSERIHVGSAWEEATASDASKRYYRVAVDLGGIVPPMYCRIAENSKRRSEKSPSHYMFFSPVNGEDRAVGSFWPRKAQETGDAYLIGTITPHRFGIIEVRGGAKLDLRLVDGGIGVKLVASKAAPDADDKNRPTHYLLRLVRRGKKAAAETVEDDVEDLVEGEAGEEEEAA